MCACTGVGWSPVRLRLSTTNILIYDRTSRRLQPFCVYFFFPLFCIRVFLLFSVRRLVPAAYRCVTHYCIIIMGSFTPYIISRIILSVIAYIIYTLLAPSRGYGFRVRLLYTLHYCRSRTPLSFSCAARTYNTYMGHRQHTPRDRT